ncbi:MAG: UDP-N-acetylglucosamine 1-carboxyvinyltransferase [Thermacetogeniaceae bacterium]
MEDKYFIEGGPSLSGTVVVSGSKNASLPILVASLLTADRSVISRVPYLADVDNMLKMLSEIGAQISCQDHQVIVQARELQSGGQLCQFAKTMRASFLLMGALLARNGNGCLPLPGGCAIGARPVNLHLKGLARLGAEIKIEKGMVAVSARHLRGCEICLDFPSVGATENIIMAATCAQGITTLVNAAAEPEIVDLACFLNQMGARVTGAGSPVVQIEGGRPLHGAVHSVIPDRIEAGTYMLAAAATGGQVRLKHVIPEHLRVVIAKLREAGVDVDEGTGELFVWASRDLTPLTIATAPHPGFPTDMQPQFTALLATTRGTSRITEAVFENRFLYVQELRRMGACIEPSGDSIIIRGIKAFKPARVKVTDLRAGAALTIAALGAWGETEIDCIYHLDRGYEELEDKLSGLGARIRRVAEQAANL